MTLYISVTFSESSPKTGGSSGDDWRSAFDAAANGSVDYNSYGDYSRTGSNGHSRHHSDPAQNGDMNSVQTPAADVLLIGCRHHHHSLVQATSINKWLI
jgi:hypothetical protein